MKAQIASAIAPAVSPARFDPMVKAQIAEFPLAAAIAPTKPITLCHFSTIHTDLKSRSFHRACLPLAAAGIAVRYVSPLKFHGRRDGVDFIPIGAHPKRLKRLLAAPSLLKTLLAQAADIYHFQDTELLPLAFALKLLFRKRVIYDAYEDFPSIARSHASIPRLLRPIAAQFMAATEHLAARCFDGITTADPFTLRRLARTGRSRKIVFHNFPNFDFFPPPSPQPKPFDLVYRGGLSERAGTFVLLNAMRLLANRGQPARLSLIGYHDSPAAEADLLERIRVLGLKSTVVLTGKIAHEDMAAALSSARIGVSPLQDTSKFRVNIPVKVFEYWACGLPVIASDLPSIRPYFKNARAGLLFPPGDASSLAQSIAWMLDHPAQAARMGLRGRYVILQRFNNRNEVRKLLDLCFRVASSCH
ncbi:MAG: glycosyltransferase [Candidatus Acidiferrales bacterium]